jgi:hypothetical protein
MIEMAWDDVYYGCVTSDVTGQPLIFIPTGKQARGLSLNDENQTIDFGEPIGVLQVRDLREAAFHYRKVTDGKCHPQLAALVFQVTHQPRLLNTYFPLTKILNANDQGEFYRLIQYIIRQSGFDLWLVDEHGLDRASQMPAHIVYLVAGHLAEMFFYRRDILECLLSTPRHFWLYTTPEAFKKAGGVAGGNFNPTTGAVQLVVSRLYEGFNAKTPGVAPFLHEFGHMLDYFEAGEDKITNSRGLLPGLHPDDGAIYTPDAREAFLKGKKLELERYLRFYNRTYHPGDPLPIGHPYVFQNDSEFVAGYLEMFFRNPHYFAAQNPDLYQGFALLFQHDPRPMWTEDFPFYIEQNRGFYLSGQRPGKPNLTV